MQRRKDTVDNNVKRAFDKLQKPAYREDLWKGIEAQLPAERKPFAWYKWGVAAALIIGIGAGGYFINLENGDVENYTQTKHVTRQLEKGNIEDNSTANTYKQVEKNALAIDKSGRLQNKNADVNNFLHNIRKTQAEKITIENNIAPFEQHIASDNTKTISALTEKYIALVDVKLNPVTENELVINAKYPDKKLSGTQNKKPSSSALNNGKNTMYAFWKNAAYTGEQGRLNLSFDDRQSVVGNNNRGEFTNVFGAEYVIPKTSLAFGIYHHRVMKTFSLKTTSGLSASLKMLNLGNGYIRAGAGVTYVSSKLFVNTLSYSDQIDPARGFSRLSAEREIASNNYTYGLDAGIWYTSPGLVAGFSSKNVNQPKYGHTSDGQRLNREYQLAAGYNINLKNNLSVMPWLEIESSGPIRKAGSMLQLSYKNACVLGVGYQNMNSSNLRGDLSGFASVQVKKRVRIYGSYGKNLEIKRLGLQQNIIQTGLRYQLP